MKTKLTEDKFKQKFLEIKSIVTDILPLVKELKDKSNVAKKMSCKLYDKAENDLYNEQCKPMVKKLDKMLDYLESVDLVYENLSDAYFRLATMCKMKF